MSAIRKAAAATKRYFSREEEEEIKEALRSAGQQNWDKARGSVEGVGWTKAEEAADTAARTGDACGLRDAAIILTMSDCMLRISEASALNTADVQVGPDGSGAVRIRRSKTDQQGKGTTLFIGTLTVDAINDWVECAGIKEGALFITARGQKGRDADLHEDRLQHAQAPFPGHRHHRRGRGPQLETRLMRFVRHGGSLNPRDPRSRAMGDSGACSSICRRATRESLGGVPIREALETLLSGAEAGPFP